MLRRVFFVIFFLFYVSLSFAAEFVTGDIIVKYRRAMAVQGVGQSYRAQSVASSFPYELSSSEPVIKERKTRVGIAAQSILQTAPALADFQVLHLKDSSKMMEAIDYLNRQPDVEFAQPNYLYHLNTTTPNDPNFNQQIYLGQIKATDGWDISHGEQRIITVAVIDTGVDSTHPDLASVIDYEHAYDFYHNTSTVVDNYGHGTHVAGLIAAVANNSTGIAGINWNCKIIPYRVFDNQSPPEASLQNIYNALRAAVLDGAKVINLSLGGGYDSQALGMQFYIDAAYDANVAIIAAAGNDNVEMTLGYRQSPVCNDGSRGYNEVLGVAAVDSNDKKAYFSNYSSLYVDVSAPGVNILSTYPVSKGSYATMSGTSMATPIVAGVASLILAVRPTLSVNDLYHVIMDHADLIESLNPAYTGKLGGGRVNLLNAIVAVSNIPSPNPTATITIDAFYNYPNPFNSDIQGTTFYIKVSQIPAAAEIRLYSLSGKLLRTFRNISMANNWVYISFNGLDDMGNSLSPGVYFMVALIQDYSGHWITRKNKMAIFKS